MGKEKEKKNYDARKHSQNESKNRVELTIDHPRAYNSEKHLQFNKRLTIFIHVLSHV